MIKLLISCILIMAVSLGSLPVFAQNDEEKGKLNAFEEQVEDEKTSEENEEAHETKSSEAQSTEDSSTRSNSIWSELLFEITKIAFYLTFIGPADKASLYSNQFSAYPYQAPHEGIYSDSTGKSLSYNVYGHYLYHSTDLHGLSFRNQLLPLPFLSVQVDYSLFMEKLETETDYLHLINIFINYHRVRIERWTFWWGLGSKGIIGEDSRFGAAFNLGTLIYPAQPISVKAEYNIGSINSTSVQELLLQVNYHMNRHVIYLGYQKHKCGSADLDGIISGYGVHF